MYVVRTMSCRRQRFVGYAKLATKALPSLRVVYQPGKPLTVLLKVTL